MARKDAQTRADLDGAVLVQFRLLWTPSVTDTRGRTICFWLRDHSSVFLFVPMPRTPAAVLGPLVSDWPGVQYHQRAVHGR